MLNPCIMLLAMATPSPQLSDLSFMGGSWSCEIWGGQFEETWSKPIDGSMTGMGRHRSEGKTGFIEFMTVETDKDGKITMYIAMGALSKEPKKAEPFPLTKLENGVATFERGGTDYPAKIVYKAVEGGLNCQIFGGGKSDNFNFKPQ